MQFTSAAIIKALRHLLSDTLKKLDAAIMWYSSQSFDIGPIHAHLEAEITFAGL